jgi:membrane-associated phospholipid phosphatase
MIQTIGYYVPYILFVITIFLMPSKTLVLAFIIGFILNSMINGLLKYFIAEPRPSQEYQHIDMFGKVHIKKTDKLGIHEYGMPSGHAQHAWFCVVYVWCVLHNVYISALYSILAVYTSVQRVDLNSHTATQVIVGSIIGGFLGYLTYKNRRLSDITR